MLNNKELATITNTLQIPFVVGDVLNGQDALTDDLKFSLHETISDMQPDTALLGIAISALKIANIYTGTSPSIDVLAIECERIIAEYGPLWLQNAQEASLETEDILDLLAHTAEDLESLTELLDLNCGFLRLQNANISALCDLLYVQAKSQAMIAEEFLSVAQSQYADNTPETTNMPVMYTDNVIQFPFARA
jgi:hypothetical protein